MVASIIEKGPKISLECRIPLGLVYSKKQDKLEHDKRRNGQKLRKFLHVHNEILTEIECWLGVGGQQLDRKGLLHVRRPAV